MWERGHGTGVSLSPWSMHSPWNKRGTCRTCVLLHLCSAGVWGLPQLSPGTPVCAGQGLSEGECAGAEFSFGLCLIRGSRQLLVCSQRELAYPTGSCVSAGGLATASPQGGRDRAA